VADITSLRIADPPDLWNELGFITSAGVCWISGIGHELGAPGRGIVAWTLHGADSLVELPRADSVTEWVKQPTPDHPNGVIAVDHIVVATPDLDRTSQAFDSAGIHLRRTRDTGTTERPARQAFFRVGETIVEVVGPATAPQPGEASFYGLAFTVADLDQTAAFFGVRLRPSREAVQSGRRIAVLDREAGSTVPLAFMSPKP
jgi:hypothetical protein